MTVMTKAVYRRTRGEASVLFTKARPIVVGLLPGDVIEFREAGRRGRWYLSVENAFRYAVRLKTAAELAERRAAKKAR